MLDQLLCPYADSSCASCVSGSIPAVIAELCILYQHKSACLDSLVFSKSKDQAGNDGNEKG